MINRRLFYVILLVIFTATVSSASQTIPDPTPSDTCPVCGMFVAQYPNWVTTVLYQDGVSHHFDGSKDLFTYLLDMEKWAKGRKADTIQSVTIKEYYGLKKIDAHEAYYVVGSDTMGPMGHELIPFATIEEAETFKRDHKGKKIYRFSEIDMNVISPLKKGHHKMGQHK